ncbi:MAG: MFS transporter [Coriobacteriia bacterium]|nr:MFS transporter [Coriobacteriia bacterium]
MSAAHTPRAVIGAYISSSLLFTLATSLIWATNTIFMMQVGGLTIFQVMLVNSIYLVAQAIFEVPTGVIADTLGRKVSYLIGIGTILASTLLYVATPTLGWGFWGFSLASVLIGLGFTFQTGAVDAWLVDALDAVGYDEPKERVFAWGQMTFGAGMLTGSLLGGLLGQVNLGLPYIVRAALLVAAFVLVLVLFADLGFERRALSTATFARETRSILEAGVRFGWHDRVVRPLLFVSLVGGVFYMFAFYSWQPYVLDLLGKNAVWMLGIIQAGISLTGIAGNALVKPIMGSDLARRDPARVLAWTSVAQTVIVAGIAAVGLFTKQPGVLPFSLVVGLWLAWGVVFGVSGPIRQSYINANIPSAQRATVLSLDAFFGDVGGGVGQPALGWLSQQSSIALGWLVGAVFVGATAPLYVWSERAAASRNEVGVTE